MYIDLEGKDLAQIKSLSVGQTVEVMVTGKVCNLSQNEHIDSEGKSHTAGSLALEEYSVEILEDEDNEYSAMADEDE